MQMCIAFVLLSLLMATTSATAIPLLIGTHSRTSPAADDDGLDPPPAISASETAGLAVELPAFAPASPQTPAATPEIAAPAAPAPADEAPAAAVAPAQPSAGPVHIEPLEPFAVQTPPRRVVSYDQRQEGKYNIRADLENFMIVVIPSSPSSGASLLDLLQRQQKHQQKSSAAAARPAAHKKDGPHKKYHAPGAKADNNASVGKSSPLNSRTNLVLLQEAVSAELARRAAPEQNQPQQPFIEGRTPYHVDISSAGLLPLEPASVLSSRASRASHAPRELGHNSVVLIGQLHPTDEDAAVPSRHHQRRGFAWADVFSKSSERYDALLRGNDDEDLAEDEGADSVDRLAAGETTKSGGGADDGWDQLTLLGADEQCGPDRRRDSYGVCQFVPNY